ncbi:phospholipase A2 group XV, partial [Nephila pilipes]
LVYNNQTRKTTNYPGVDIRVPGFGDTSTLEIIDPHFLAPHPLGVQLRHHPWTEYYKDIVTALVEVGYVRNISVRGAPYDFRKAPNELQDYYANLKHLIEETYEINDETKTTIVCHSMGCPIMSYFLNTIDQTWKDKYIKGMITIGGAWGGAVKAMKTITA